MAQDIDFGDPIQFGGSKPQTVASAMQQSGPRPLFSQMHATPAHGQPGPAQTIAQTVPPQAPAAKPQVIARNASAMAPLPRFASHDSLGATSPTQVQPMAPGTKLQMAPGIQPNAPQANSEVPQQPLPSPYENGSGTGKKIMMIVIGVIAVSIVGGIAYLLYMRFASDPETTQNNQVNSFVTNTTQSGANANKDEDDDGLLNYEEVQYGTDPAKADTDGDGFKDGDEVEKGFDPKGSGKLPTPGRF